MDKDDSWESPAQVAPRFDLKVVEAGRSVMVEVVGPLDVEHSPKLLNRVLPMCGYGRRVVLDLRRADYVDSSGVRALLSLRSDLDGERGELRLVIRPGSRIERTLGLLRLQDCFPTYAHAAEAWGDHRKAA